MSIVEQQFAACLAARDRIEAEAWAENGVYTPAPKSERSVFLPFLEVLMEQRRDRNRWRALCITAEELRKHIA